MVQLYVGVTDRNWFDMLAASSPHDEINFWQPSGNKQFRALRPGELFLFKLHAPDNFIVGGGIYGHASNVPLSIAWESFAEKNGVRSLAEMRTRIAHYRRDDALLDPRSDPVIGCRILTQPFFWPRDLWIKVPESWSSNIVQGKGFATDDEDGRHLWDAVTDRLAGAPVVGGFAEAPSRYGTPHLITPRLGQGAFRFTVTDNYERRCAITGERTLPILDAAHIKSYKAGGEHVPSNGLLLRTDIHRLFDLGYVSITTDSKFVVSRRLRADFENGKYYYEFDGAPVRPPRKHASPPSKDALEWHRDHRFLR
jgi:putative restriction endonuclease